MKQESRGNKESNRFLERPRKVRKLLRVNVPEYKTRITSMAQYESLISQGFEITNVYYEFPPGVIIIRLAKGTEEIIAEANSIFEYLIHLKPLYDFKKKKNCFVYVTDVEVYTAFEMALPMMIPGTPQHPIVTKSLNTKFANEIYTKLSRWSNQISDRYNNALPTEVFSMVHVIEEHNHQIKTKTYGKELLTSEKLTDLHNQAALCDNSIALSFFMLRENISPPGLAGDIIIGIIVYDLKSRKTLAFNLQSITSFLRESYLRKERGFYDVINSLFTRSVDENLKFKSYLPLPIDTPWYTVLPWMCYLALLPVPNDNSYSNKLNIPQFFTFGFTLSPNQSSFTFHYFSNTKKGRGTCVFYLFHGQEIRPYNLRFDQSLGQRLIHVDFAFYEDGRESKLIAHRPLDFEDVYNYNRNIFIAMMFAGMFDAHFTTLIKNGIKGLEKLASQNSAFLYPAYFIYMIERFAKELDNEGYKILDKLLAEKPLEQNELEYIKRIGFGDFKIVAEDEHGNFGLTVLGYAVLVRHKRGQSHIRIT